MNWIFDDNDECGISLKCPESIRVICWGLFDH